MNIYRVFWGTYNLRPRRNKGKGMAYVMSAVPIKKCCPVSQAENKAALPGGRVFPIDRAPSADDESTAVFPGLP